MNDHDTYLLSMLLRYSQRRMVAVLSQVPTHFRGDAAASSSLGRLVSLGLVYIEGPSVRLTMAGFAHALAGAAPARVHRLRGQAPSKAA